MLEVGLLANVSSVTAVFTFVENKQGVFLNYGSTAVSNLLVLLAFEERIPKFSLQSEIRYQTLTVCLGTKSVIIYTFGYSYI